MATNYPSSQQTFTNPSGTSLVTSPDHAVMHATENDTLVAIQTVMGTTAGTSVLKDFVAGQFPARVNSGGTIVQTLTGGTINSTNLVTPTLGVATATTINKVTITQPANAGTLTIADGAVLNVSASGTVSGSNTGDQTNITGNAATVTTNANLTGDVTSVGNATSIGSGVIVDADVNASAAIAVSKLAITGTPTGAKFLRDDAAWTAIPGGGDALVANPLSQFAATTSLQFAGVITDETGTGSVVLATSPTLVTPILGTPTSATLTNATGLPIATGVSGLAANVAGFLGTPSSANLAAALTDETGSGLAVFGTSPTLSGATMKNMVDETLTTGGTTTAYTLTPSVAIGSYVTGHRFLVKFNATCGASPTINISGLGAKNLTKGGATALSAGDVLIDGLYVIEYDGTQFQVLGGSAGSSGSTAFVSNEVPSGSVNGSNVDFTAAASMVSSSLKVYQNGVRLKGGGVDFTQGSGAAFSFVTAPTTGDLLLIDYSTSTGTYSTGSTSFVYDETPSGSINSSNVTFTIASTPVSGSLIVYRDGQRLIGGGADYTLSGTTITFVTAPVTGSTLKVDYQSAVSAAGNADTVDGYHASNNSETDGTLVANYGGWIVINDTLSYSSADSPTFVIGTTKDLTGVIGVGMRIKLTQTTAKYFIVTAITSTTITVYGGTDYTLANAAITLPYFSYQKAPLGFPQSPAKWTVTTSDTTQRSQASPVASTWYNLGTITQSIPIGVWNLSYVGYIQLNKTASVNDLFITLSTANNSESDTELTYRLTCYGDYSGNTGSQKKLLALTSKTSYYLNEKTDQSSGTTLYLRSDLVKTIISSVCAYL